MSIAEDHNEDISSLPAGRQVYELSYLVLPSIPEENLPQVVANIQAVIEKEGGNKIDGEDPFLRELAYEMSKVVGASRYVVKNAYIGWIKFDLPALPYGREQAGLPAQKENEKRPIEVIKEKVEKMAEILRFLLVKTPKETKFTFASTRKAKEEIPEEVTEEEIIEPVDEQNIVVE